MIFEILAFLMPKQTAIPVHPHPVWTTPEVVGAIIVAVGTIIAAVIGYLKYRKKRMDPLRPKTLKFPRSQI